MVSWEALERAETRGVERETPSDSATQACGRHRPCEGVMSLWTDRL